MNFKSVAIFLAGVVVGMTAPYKFFKNKYREEKEMEIDSIKQWKDDEIRALKIRLGEESEPEVKKSDKKENENGTVGEDSEDHHTPFTVKSSIELCERPDPHDFVDYALYSKKEYEEKVVEYQHPKEDTSEEEDVYTSEPREIDFGEYNANRFYSKVELRYYTLDDMLVREEFDSSDVDDQEIVNEDNAVGNVLKISGFKDNGVDEIYIRNFAEKTDYYIKKAVAHYYV